MTRLKASPIIGTPVTNAIWFSDSYGQPLLIISPEGKLTFGEGVHPKEIVQILRDAFDQATRVGAKRFIGYVCEVHGTFHKPGTESTCDEYLTAVYADLP